MTVFNPFIITIFATLIVISISNVKVNEAPIVVGRTTSSLLVQFEPFYSADSGDTMAYELSSRSILSPQWRVVSDSIETSSYNQSEGQIISVRVDSNALPMTGYFQLGLQRNGLIAEDFQHESRTSFINWDASAADMKTALGSLKNVIVREVRRCDENGDSVSGLGGFEGT